MSLRMAILGVLDGRPMTGYELGAFFEASANWVWNAKLSQIYPLLNSMADEGVISREEEATGRRHSTRYDITEEGKEELRDWLAAEHPLQAVRDSAFLQGLFLELLDAHEVEAVLDAFIAQHEERIAGWREHQRQLLDGETQLIRERMESRPAHQHDRMRMMKALVFSGLVRQSEAAISWARDMQAASHLNEGMGPE
ncbi:PadR family transcriptional regulator [Granulicoccus sp. GXG6511]|uniref:PadR family transcriptional regulator n=1 Tax=Granulicoccus sp. GXG6511 TaxID=3381351 RepID=UPI003D7DF19A